MLEHSFLFGLLTDSSFYFFGNPDARKGETVDWWVTPLGPGPAVRTGVIEAMRQAKLTGDAQDYLPYQRLAWDPVH